MTAAIPAERIVAGQLAKRAGGNSRPVTQAKKVLVGNSGSKSANRKSGPDSVPDRNSRTSTASRTSSESFGGYGRGARSGRSRPSASRSSQPHIRVLVLEWLLAALLLVFTVPSEKGAKGYSNMMASMMLRESALAGIFFALSLIGSVQRAAKFSIWFGFIIDLGLLFHAVTNGSSGVIANVFTGKPILSQSGGGVTLAADFESKDAPPQPTPFASTSSGSSNSGSGTGTPSSGGNGANLSPTYPGGPGSTIPTPGIPA